MRLWPFPKKQDEVEALSPDCELPAGVMLASPEESASPNTTTVPSYGNSISSNPVDPAAHLNVPQGLSRLELMENAEALQLSQSIELSFPQSNLPPFSPQLETQPQANTAPPFSTEISAPKPSPAKPAINLQFDQWQAPEPSASPQALFDPSTMATTANTFNDLLPPVLPKPASLADEWALSPPEETGIPLQTEDAKPSSFELSPADEHLSPLPAVYENLGFLSAAPQEEPISAGLASTLAPDPMPAKPPLENLAMAANSEFAPSSLLETMNMIPPPLAPAEEPMSFSSFGNMDFGTAPTWELEPISGQNSDDDMMMSFSMPIELEDDEASASFDLGGASEASINLDPPLSMSAPSAEPLAPLDSFEPTMMGMAPPLALEDDWSASEDVANESAELNSSDAAYDMNHYDDPDEPAQTFELTEPDQDIMPASNLQAMANLLSNVIPYDAKEDPQAAPLMMASEEESCSWGISEEAQDFDDEACSLLSEEPDECSTGNLAYFMESTEPTAPSESWESEEPLASMEIWPEAEPVAEVRGLPATPAPEIQEALSATFIARAKPEPEPAPQPVVTPIVARAKVKMTRTLPAAPPLPPNTPSLVDPSHLPCGKTQTLSQALGNFEQEMLLKETRFVKQSINNLVDRYFAQQDTDHSW